MGLGVCLVGAPSGRFDWERGLPVEELGWPEAVFGAGLAGVSGALRSSITRCISPGAHWGSGGLGNPAVLGWGSSSIGAEAAFTGEPLVGSGTGVLGSRLDLPAAIPAADATFDATAELAPSASDLSPSGRLRGLRGLAGFLESPAPAWFERPPRRARVAWAGSVGSPTETAPSQIVQRTQDSE